MVMRSWVGGGERILHVSVTKHKLYLYSLFFSSFGHKFSILIVSFIFFSFSNQIYHGIYVVLKTILAFNAIEFVKI